MRRIAVAALALTLILALGITSVAAASNGLGLAGSQREAAGISPSLKPPPPEPVAPEVSQVDFRENTLVRVDLQTNSTVTKPLLITEWEGADEIEWKASKGTVKKNWPVVYVQGSLIKLVAQFEFEAATREFLEKDVEGPVTVTGELTLGTKTLNFEKTFSQKEAKEEAEKNKTFITTGLIESSLTVPAKVAVYEKAGIKWRWKGTEAEKKPFNQSLGESKHNIITTRGKLVSTLNPRTDVYFTLLYLTAQKIAAKTQLPSETETIEGDFEPFKTRAMNAINYNVANGEITSTATLLKYYSNVTKETLAQERTHGLSCSNTTVESLVEKKEGQCGAWAYAFPFTLGYEGIKSEVFEIEPKFGGGTECGTAGSCFFIVKEWLFEGAGTQAAPFQYLANEIKDLEGIPGQGTSNPDSIFSLHYIDKTNGAEETLYDPSYGAGPLKAATKAGVFLKYQEESIGGYCKETTPVVCQKPESKPQAAKLLETLFTSF